MNILTTLRQKKSQNKKAIAVLIDPDKNYNEAKCSDLIDLAYKNNVDYFLVGGSLIVPTVLSQIVKQIKKSVSIPIVIFPGNSLQISKYADGIFFLSLISGRNPDFLIGQHVIAAPTLQNTSLEIIPTGYLLINSGSPTSVGYISNTTPIPANKPSLAAYTALAGEMLGLNLMYLDAGSGAEQEINAEVIYAVQQMVKTPIVVGGGITTTQKALSILEAGADMIVLGNVLENNPDILPEITNKIQYWNRT